MATAKVDITNLLIKLDLLNETVAQEAELMIKQVTELAAEVARKKLISSTTKWGRKRFSEGRGASDGRDDTGSMIADLQAYDFKVSEGLIEARFGWGPGKAKKYYKYQEYGTAKIKAALSLFEGRTAMVNEMPRLIKNMKARIARKMK
jgi:hypothetical protein